MFLLSGASAASGKGTDSLSMEHSGARKEIAEGAASGVWSLELCKRESELGGDGVYTAEGKHLGENLS